MAAKAKARKNTPGVAGQGNRELNDAMMMLRRSNATVGFSAKTKGERGGRSYARKAAVSYGW